MKKTILYLRTDITEKELVAGGSVSHTVGVLQGFIRLGYVVVCASSCMAEVLRTMPLKQLNILRLPRGLTIFRWKLSCFFSTFFFTRQLLALSKNRSYECVYQRYSILNFTGVLFSKIKKIPLILEYNGSEVWVDRHWSRSRWFKVQWLIAWVEKINLQHAATIVVVSRALHDDLVVRGIDARKILVNPNGVDTELYDPARLVDERAAVRNSFGIEEKFVFGFIGTFSPWHGIEILAQMIPQVVAQNPRAHFVLIGDGPLKKILCRELRSVMHAVTLVGTIPSGEAKKYLAACDAFLCPTQPNADGSRFFGSPTKLFEYMSMGKPIIASDMEQLRELLMPEGADFLVAPTVVQDFVRKALQLMDLSEQERTALGDRVRTKVVAQYTWTHHAQHIAAKGFCG